jgi:hypothetical protein
VWLSVTFQECRKNFLQAVALHQYVNWPDFMINAGQSGNTGILILLQHYNPGGGGFGFLYQLIPLLSISSQLQFFTLSTSISLRINTGII